MNPPEAVYEDIRADMDGMNADETTTRIRRLSDKWNDVKIRTRVETAYAYDNLKENIKDGYIGGAYVWVVRDPEGAPTLTPSMPDFITEDKSRVLMILPRGNDQWGIPGGGQESNESFKETAIREVKEEVGIECEVKDCFLLRRIVTKDEHDKRPPLHFLQVFFNGEYVDGTISIQGGELNGAAWFGDPPDSIEMMPVNRIRGESFFASDC